MTDEKKDAGQKVLIGCIVPAPAEFCVEPFLESVKAQDNQDFDLVFADVTSDEKFRQRLESTGNKVISASSTDIKDAMLNARNKLRDMVINEGYSHLLLVDINILLQKDALSRFIFHKKDVVAGTYLILQKIDGRNELTPVLYDFAGENAVRAMELREVLEDRLIEVSCAGFGCVFLSAAVLEKIKFRFYTENKTGDNIAFFLDARNAGFKTYGDTTIKCNQIVRHDNEKLNNLFSFDAYPTLRNPKVMIGCVTHNKDEQYLPAFLESIRAQDYKNYDIVFVDTSDDDAYIAKLKGTGAIALKPDEKEEHTIKKIVAGRTKLRRYALENGYDYLLFVDTDVRPPKTALSKLLSTRKDVVAGLCLSNINISGTTRVMPCIYDFDDEEGYCRPMFLNHVLNNDIKEISCAGFGCTLATRKVLEKVGIRYYEKSMAGEDIAFFIDAREAGFRAFADNSVKCAHLVFPEGDPRNRKFMFETYEKGVNYNIKVGGKDS
jgi:GT2 family glycosyltransferase